jgi:hypothetical protein
MRLSAKRAIDKLTKITLAKIRNTFKGPEIIAAQNIVRIRDVYETLLKLLMNISLSLGLKINPSAPQYLIRTRPRNSPCHHAYVTLEA